jgi:hypothetical protein
MIFGVALEEIPRILYRTERAVGSIVLAHL